MSDSITGSVCVCVWIPPSVSRSSLSVVAKEREKKKEGRLSSFVVFQRTAGLFSCKRERELCVMGIYETEGKRLLLYRRKKKKKNRFFFSFFLVGLFSVEFQSLRKFLSLNVNRSRQHTTISDIYILTSFRFLFSFLCPSLSTCNM